jgi:hypothetical protein
MPTSPSRRRSMGWANCKTSYECLRGPLVRGIGDWLAAFRLGAQDREVCIELGTSHSAFINQ